MAQRYRSTRGGSEGFTFTEAVLKGLADDGGLFIPHAIPSVPTDFLRAWYNYSFQDLALAILSLYISPQEISQDELRSLVNASYKSFRHEDVTPLRRLRKDLHLYVLELFHGPTYAFKDVALQFLGNLFEMLLKKKNVGKEVPETLTVVGATSGDTGSAAIYGLRNKEHVSVFILHPKGRVSPIQEAQMTTVLDANVHNIAVEGTFDDCQDIVKALFGDQKFNDEYHLGAVNSINWARILAQIIYYFHSYFSLLRRLQLSPTEPSARKIRLQYIVPTGNFGDILAGYYAKKMGLPIERLVVATNSNDILDRFWRTGRYEKHTATTEDRNTHHGLAADGVKAHEAGAIETLSPAMDILVSSNFERLLWHLVDETTGHKHPEEAGLTIASWMKLMKTSGRLEVPENVIEAARADFVSERVSDDQTVETIKDFYAGNPGEGPYILDPHTAVGVAAAMRVIKTPVPEQLYNISLATAHPAKFSNAVDLALKTFPGYNFDQVMPEEFRDLLTKERRVSNIERPEPELVKQEIIKLLAR